jgi:hypothetical protein
LGVIGFRSQAGATEYDNSGGLAQASNSRSNPSSIETTDWEQNLVDPDGSGAVSLTLDSVGIPHISYFAQEEYGQTPRAFKYATKPHDIWVTEEVIAETDLWNSYLIDQSSSVALDENDSPHIAFGLLGHNEAGEVITVTHAFKQNGYWSIGEIDATENACRIYEGDLLSDSSGALHLFYIVSDIVDGRCELRLKYAREVEKNSWQVSTLVEENVSYFSVLIDNDDTFHLAYTTYVETSSLHYSKFGSIAEFSPTIIFEEQEGQSVVVPSVLLDSSNTPHIVFGGDAANYSEALYVARQEQTGWSIEGPIKSLGVLQDADSFFDMQGNLHVFVADFHWGGIYGSRTAVEHYYQTHDGWQEEELGGASSTSFALDSYGNIHGATGGWTDPNLVDTQKRW